MTEIYLDGNLVQKAEFYLTGEDGERMWIRFYIETPKGIKTKKVDTFVFKGGL